MAALSYANAWTLISAVVLLLDESDKFANANSDNFDGMHDAVAAANLGDYQSAVIAGVDSLRARLSSMLEPAAVRAAIAGPLAEMMAAINVPERGPVDVALFRLKEYMIGLGTDDTVNAREFTRGSASAGGSNVGTGTINRLNVDEDGYPLEASHAEVKTFECVQDQNQVELHEEVFEVRGEKSEPDRLLVDGSGIRTRIPCISHRSTQAILANPSFSQFSGTQPSAGSESTPAATDSVTGWVVTTIAAARVSVDTVYRDLVGETHKHALRFTANNKIVQTLSEQRRARLSTSRPYYVQVAIYRESSCDGTLTIRWGANTQAFTVSNLNSGAWNVVRLDLDKDLYYKNFKESGFTFEIELGSRTTGSIYIDDVIIAPMSLIDGTFYAIVGSPTAFLLRDVFTVTDSHSATRGKIQYWLAFRSGVGLSLPAVTAGAETIADPS